MGCQKASAQQSVEHEAEDVRALQRNHGTLYAAVGQQFQTARHTVGEEASLQAYETEENQHGRVEIRRHWTLEAPLDLAQKGRLGPAPLLGDGRIGTLPHG